MTKNISTKLKSVLDIIVKMVNFVKSRALKTRLLKQICLLKWVLNMIF